jgi:hypothetical protein
MYKIHQDDGRPGRFRLRYFMQNNLIDPLYTIENLGWEDVSRFVKQTEIDKNELTWAYDMVRLMNKQVSITDTGNWSIL